MNHPNESIHKNESDVAMLQISPLPSHSCLRMSMNMISLSALPWKSRKYVKYSRHELSAA